MSFIDILESEQSDLDVVVEVTARRIKRVRGGKVVKKRKCPKGYTLSGTRCKKQGAKERVRRKRAGRKSARKSKSARKRNFRRSTRLRQRRKLKRLKRR